MAVVPAYMGEVVRMEIEVFSGADVWLDARAANESFWDGTFSGDNEIDSDLFVGEIRWQNTGDRIQARRTDASTGTMSAARDVGGTLNGLYAHVSHDGTTAVLTSDMITAMTAAGTGSILLEFSTPIPAATAGGTATLVFATNALAGSDPDPTVTVDTTDQEVAGATAIQLAATATDADSYAWAAAPDVGTFDDAAVEDPTWTAPAATTDDQVIMLTLTVTGNGTSVNASVTVTVTGTGDPIPVVPSYVGEVVRMEIEVFDSADVWLEARDTDESQWDGTFTGDNEIDSDLFIGRLRWRDSGDRISVNRTTASTGSLLDARLVGGTLNGLYLHVTHVGTTEVFTSDQILTSTSAGATHIQILFSTPIPAATTGDTAILVIASNTLAGTGTDPTVSVATQDQDVAGGAVLQLSATATDADSYSWTAAPNVGTFSDTAIEDPTWTAPAATVNDQVIVLTLTVAGNGTTANASVTITVTGTGVTPVPIQTTNLLSVTMSGTTMPLLANRFKLRDRVEERSTADFQIRDDTGNCPLCIASFGTPVVVSDRTGVVFDGFVYSVNTRRLAPSAGTEPPPLVHVVRLMDNHYRADKRLVAAVYQDMTAGEIVLALWTTILESEGVNILTPDTVFPGPTLRQVIFNYVPVTTALDRLAEAANYVWWIGHDRSLYFQPRSTIAAPWILTGADIQGVPVWKRHATKYRNQQFVTGARITTDIQVESFRGNGVQQTFVVGYPLASVPLVEVNHMGGGYAANTIGIRGLEMSHQWYWSKGSNEISQELADTPLSDQHVLRVTYSGQTSVIAIVKLKADQEARAVLEETTTGLVDALSSDRNLDTSEAAIEFANSQLMAYGETSLELRFTTRRAGLAAGQLLNIMLPNAAPSGST